jgi:hypothetical protein
MTAIGANDSCTETKRENKCGTQEAKATRRGKQNHDLQINEKLSRKERQQIADIVYKYPGLLDETGEKPRTTKGTKHRINTGNAKPVGCRYNRRYSKKERDIIMEQVTKMEKAGVVRASDSPWSAPVVLVKKKNGGTRFCIDFRELNKVTVKDQYPLPRVDDALDCLSGATFFTSLDLKSGYWQCEVEEEDKAKTAFTTPDGLYEFNVMPFGLCNAPATFERMIDVILRGMKWNICMCYLDDIVVFGKTIEEHNERLDRELRCLDEANLSLNMKKCQFAANELIVLGHEVSGEGVCPDPSKTSAVNDFPTPKSVKDVRSFLGLCSYYRRFIENFAKIAGPLNKLLKSQVAFKWSQDEQAAFDTLKTKLTSAPVLAHFNENLPVEIHSDASGYALGVVLIQKYGSDEKVIAYASRSLDKCEKILLHYRKGVFGNRMEHEKI